MNNAQQREFLSRLQHGLEVVFGRSPHTGMVKVGEWSLYLDLRRCDRPPTSKVYALDIGVRAHHSPPQLYVRMEVGVRGEARDPEGRFNDMHPDPNVSMDGGEVQRLIEVVQRHTDADLEAYHSRLFGPQD